MKRPTQLLLLLTLTSSASLAQTTWQVPGDASSIQGGIDLASTGDTVLVGPGTWSPYTLNFKGKELLLASTDGAEATVLDGFDYRRLFLFENGEGPDAVVQGFTLTRGYAGTGGHGGAVLLSGFAEPTFRDCVFRANYAGNGSQGAKGANGDDGKDAGDDGEKGSTGKSGKSGGHGGAVYIDQGSPRFERCVFYGNRAGAGGQGGTGGSGGDGSDWAFLVSAGDGADGGKGGYGGSGGRGGAIYTLSYDSQPLIANCLFANNYSGPGGKGGTGGSGGDGGDGDVIGGDGSDGDKGGGGNGGASGSGGALYAYAARYQIANATFHGNGILSGGSGGSGSGGSTGGSGSGAVLYATSQGSTIGNSLLWANSPQSSQLSGYPATVSYSNSDAAPPGTGNFSLDPALTIDPSEPWTSYTLQVGSGCIDAGDSSLVPAGSGKDLAGHQRAIDDPSTPDTGPGAPVDVGAYEYALPAEVRILAGCGNNPAGSLVHLAGQPRPGETVTLGIDNPLGTQNLGSIPVLLLSLAPSPTAPCGLLLPGQGMAGAGASGELLLSLLPNDLVQVKAVGVWLLPGSPAPADIPILPKTSLVGVTLYAQGALVDINPVATVPVGWTDAAELAIGL